jgi:predicted enzyme related to lactoylglutathione lyase
MGKRQRYEPGVFSWTDLATTDVDAAKRFYTDLFGWAHEDSPLPGGGSYTMARVDGRAVAGLSAVQQEGQPPAWSSYVTVEDADATAAKAAELGGTVIAEPFDVMEAGRMAVIADPTGAIFCVWRAGDSIGAELVNGHGLLSLTQLNTPDAERASDFYSQLFGWRIEKTEGTEPQYLGIYVGEALNAGMMQLTPDQQAPPHWLVYFGCDDVDAAAEKIGAGGGAILAPKLSVPGGEIIVAQDAQGAVFGVFTGRFDD